MTQSFLDQKYQEYKDILPIDPEKYETLEAFDAAIEANKKAIAIVLMINDDTKISKKKSLETLQKHYVLQLEQLARFLDEHPKHQKLIEEKKQFLETQEKEKALELQSQLLKNSFEHTKNKVLETALDAKDIPMAEFDFYYQNIFLEKVSNPGYIYGDKTSTGKKEKKIVINNMKELQTLDIMKTILSPTVATQGWGKFGQYNSIGAILCTIRINLGEKDHRNGLYAVFFTASIEDAASATGNAYLEKIELMGKDIVKNLGVSTPDIEIKHAAYVEQKKLLHRYK